MNRVVAWWTSPARSRHVYVVAAALGLAVYLIAFGPGHMVGTSAYWDLPQEDTRAYMMAYRYWLHEPWQWPLFETQTINVPYARSIAFSDVIPLWALINKSAATIVPPWGTFTERAYLGIWYAIVYGLQAGLGVAILRQLGHRSWGAGILSALFFLALPSWVLRYTHASLTAHFLLVWALYLYLRSPAGTPAPRRLRIVQLVQLAIASLVNPYHSVMSAGLFGASLLRSRRWKDIAVWLPCGLLAVGVFAWLAGYFTPEANTRMWGFSSGSTNILSMFIPLRSGIFGDGQRIATVVATDFQYEGWAYLGIGFLVMLAAFLPRSRTLVGVIKRHRFLFALALAFWLLALSNHIYFGSHRIVEYDIPRAMRWIASHYRAPGRFVWLPMYVLVVFLLHQSLTRWSKGWKLLVLPVLLVLQLADARGDWGWPLRFTRARSPSMLDLEAWRPLVHAHDAVFVHPSHDCIDDATHNIQFVSLEIEWLASERAIPINGMYTARPNRPCDVDAHTWPGLRASGRALHVFHPNRAWIAKLLEARGASCGEFAFGRACSAAHDAIAAAIKAGTLKPLSPTTGPTHAYGARIEVGAWTEGDAGELVFELSGEPPPSVTLRLQASAMLCGPRQAQHVDVSLDGTRLGTLQFDPTTNDRETVRSLAIPAAVRDELRRSGVAAITLRPTDVRSPLRLACSSDRRTLGVWVQRLWFD